MPVTDSNPVSGFLYSSQVNLVKLHVQCISVVDWVLATQVTFQVGSPVPISVSIAIRKNKIEDYGRLRYISQSVFGMGCVSLCNFTFRWITDN